MAPRRKARWQERLNIQKHELLPIHEAWEEELQHEVEAAAEAADDVAAAVEHTKASSPSLTAHVVGLHSSATHTHARSSSGRDYGSRAEARSQKCASWCP